MNIEISNETCEQLLLLHSQLHEKDSKRYRTHDETIKMLIEHWQGTNNEDCKQQGHTWHKSKYVFTGTLPTKLYPYYCIKCNAVWHRTNGVFMWNDRTRDGYVHLEKFHLGK